MSTTQNATEGVTIYEGNERNRIRIDDTDGYSHLFQYQLIACLDNDPHEVFADDTVIHHENGCKLDDRPENLTVLSRSAHNRLHNRGDWFPADDDWRLAGNLENVHWAGSDEVPIGFDDSEV